MHGFELELVHAGLAGGHGVQVSLGTSLTGVSEDLHFLVGLVDTESVDDLEPRAGRGGGSTYNLELSTL